MTARVAVVGGGLAGITAALDLAEAGAEVVLLERRGHLGGLTRSFRHNGLWLDNGQHVFLRCCTAYRDFIARIGAADAVVLQPRLDLPVIAPGGRTARLRRAPLPPPLHLAPALARYRHLGRRHRASAARAALALGRLDPDDPALDASTFGQWLTDHGQSPAAVARLWDLIGRPTLNLPAGEAALGAAVQVFRTGLLDTADAADIGWAAVPLLEAHGEPARRALGARGVEVVTGVAVDTIAVGDGITLRTAASRDGGPGDDGGPGVDRVDAVDRVDRGDRVDAADRVHRVDRVVLAVPPEAAAHLLPPGALAAGIDPGRLGTSAVIDVQLVLDRRVTDLPMAAGVDSLVQFVFDRTQASGAQSGQVLAVSLSAADDLLARRPSDLVGAVHTALAELFPAAGRAAVVDAVVTKERAATFRSAPGARAHRPGPATRLPGVVLAGAWTATGWPATMEGAVRSGHAAARAALDPLARTPREEVVA